MRKFFLISLILLSLCLKAQAAATYDNSNWGSVASTSSAYPSITVNVTQINQSEGGVIVAVTHCNFVGLIVGDDTEYIYSATDNGNNMTFITSQVNGTHTIEYYYYQLTPSAHSVVITFDSIANPGAPVVVTGLCEVISLYNMVQSGSPIQQFGNALGTTSPITRSLTTNNSLNINVDGNESHSGSTTISATGTNQTSRQNQAAGGKAGYMRCGMSTQPSTVASQTMSWSQSTNRIWDTTMIEVKGTIGQSPFEQYMSGEDGLY